MDYTEQLQQASSYANANQQPMDPTLVTIVVIVYVVLIVLFIIAGWKIFTKANRPGWAVLIPFYNTIVILEIIKRPIWWLILFFIPVVNFIIAFIVAMDLAKAYGRSVAFGVLLLFLLSPIGILILAFGKSKYVYGSLEKAQAANTPPQTPPATPTTLPVTPAT